MSHAASPGQQLYQPRRLEHLQPASSRHTVWYSGFSPGRVQAQHIAADSATLEVLLADVPSSSSSSSTWHAAASPVAPGEKQAAAQGKLKKPEVLAPAGGWPQLRAAVENGADAVYFGLSAFSARARATNFTPEELPEVCLLCRTWPRVAFR